MSSSSARAPDEVERLLAGYAAPVASVARAVRSAVLAALPGCGEEADDADNVIGYGYGPGYKHLVCTLILSKAGVKLGFSGGAALADPDHLLEGKGKVHRYVAVADRVAAEDPRLGALLRTALAAYRSRTA
jgi:hypothetical protein